jgi:hypothetical protein
MREVRDEEVPNDFNPQHMPTVAATFAWHLEISRQEATNEQGRLIRSLDETGNGDK